ncbi:hypothetical protein D046_9193, partial [Vibrio parahaemolyticus V-223/04]
MVSAFLLATLNWRRATLCKLCAKLLRSRHKVGKC